MGSVKGDFAQLQRLIKKVSTFGDDNFRRALNEDLAQETVSLIADGFQEQADPYGKPWAPLKYRKGQILRDTGRMANSYHAGSITGGGFRVSSSDYRAPFHQSPRMRKQGWIMPERMMVPSASGGLPPRYVTAYTAVIKVHVKSFLKR